MAVKASCRPKGAGGEGHAPVTLGSSSAGARLAEEEWPSGKQAQ